MIRVPFYDAKSFSEANKLNPDFREIEKVDPVF